MTSHAKGTVESKAWNEKSYANGDEGAKLTRASVTNAFHGDIEGEGTLEYLLFYREENFGTFIGLERVVGRIGDRSGSFVLQHSGTFEDGTIKATLSVVPGSGAGDLRGLQGEGDFVAKHGQQQVPYTLDYELE